MSQRFIEFVMMQAQNAALFLGQIPNPQTGLFGYLDGVLRDFDLRDSLFLAALLGRRHATKSCAAGGEVAIGLKRGRPTRRNSS